jgi:hypothetical protein
LSQEHPLPDKYECEIFFIEGFSKRFYEVLRKFCSQVYRKNKGFSDFQTFCSNAIARVEDLLSPKPDKPFGKYDSTKSQLSWFIYCAIRNQNSSDNYHRAKLRYFEDFEEEGSADESLYTVAENRESFFLRCKYLGIDIDRNKFLAHLKKESQTPMVLSYIWLIKNQRINSITL